MNDTRLRVALLARAGEASARIEAALREAGAELVLVAAPDACSEQDVRAAQPRAVVIALEPAVEDALDAHADLLSDPAFLVVFEDAELAVQRDGWEAARWARHLSAKLHGHGDVLPPGGEDDAQWQPSPGPLPPRAEVEDIELAIAAFADEAQLHADDVPAANGLDALQGSTLSLAGGHEEARSPFDPVAFEMGELSLLDEDGGAVPTIEGAPSGDADGVPAEAPALSLEALLEREAMAAADDDAADTGKGDEAAPSADAAQGAAPTFSTGALSLADVSDEPFTATPRSAPALDIDSFSAGLSGLSLADPDSYGHGPEQGAVLVDAGLGGPDAVRQLLGAIPEGFPRAVIVRLQLDGGRYDRLVRQMERAAALPVLLAVANAEVMPGQIHFLPPELGLRRDRGRVLFSTDGAGELLPDALPATDSALLLLSGASRQLVDAAMQAPWSSALLAGQSPDGSYDPDAALALAERGGATGTPAELAKMLCERWMPSAAPAIDLEEPEA